MSNVLAATAGSPVGVPTDPVSFPDGTSTAVSAPVLTPAFAASTAAQLSDTSRDYMVYLTVTTSGTATTVTIGPTSAASAVTIMGSAAATAGQVIRSACLRAGTSSGPGPRPRSPTSPPWAAEPVTGAWLAQAPAFRPGIASALTRTAGETQA